MHVNIKIKVYQHVDMKKTCRHEKNMPTTALVILATTHLVFKMMAMVVSHRLLLLIGLVELSSKQPHTSVNYQENIYFLKINK